MLENNAFFDRLRFSYSRGYPFVAFREDLKSPIKAYLQKTDESFFTKKFEELGFVFAPFDLDRGRVLLIPKIKSEINETLYSKVSTKSFSYDILLPDATFYQSMVEKSQELMLLGHFKKVVLSRFLSLNFKQEVDVIDVFKNLLSDYLSQYVYIWFHPLTGVWLGSSPEQFIKKRGDKVETVSLAGTKIIKNNSIPFWGNKEKEEHQIVTDYIESQLKDKLESLKKSSVTNVKAGSLWHLKTRILGQLKLNTSLVELIKVLHPTPAVCGFPRQESFKFILKNEGYDRSFYTGFLGEIGTSLANLFVNIRCIRIEGFMGKVFVGAGITQSSNALKECEETENKASTIIKSLR